MSINEVRPCGSEWVYCDGNCDICTLNSTPIATKYTMCPDANTAIDILEFIKLNYENCKTTGVQKYIDALQMGIDALKEK